MITFIHKINQTTKAFFYFCLFNSIGYYACNAIVYVTKVDILKLHKYINIAYDWTKCGYNITTYLHDQFKIDEMAQFIKITINYIQPNYISIWLQVACHE